MKMLTPGPTNEQPNPSYDRDFDENPGSNKNPSNSTVDEPFVKQSESGHKSVPNSSKTKEGNGSKGQSNQKRAGNSNFNASDLFIPREDRRGHNNPPGGHKPHWFQAKQAYGNWIEKKVFVRQPRHVYDCIPAALADELGLVRLALVFSLGLGEILAWKLEERILKWSENLIRVFGLGLRWEYYAEYAHARPLPYPNHGCNYDGTTEGKKKWQVIGGRLFFQDLLSLVTHDSLDEMGKKYYGEMARMLLTSIWARLGNRSDYVDAGRKEIFHEVFSYAYVFQTSETPYLSAGPNDTGSVAQVGLCLPPTVKQRLMAYNSYSVQCCEKGYKLDTRWDYFSLSWDLRFETHTCPFRDLAYTYFTLCSKKWVIFNTATPNTYEESGRWGRECSGFRLPETHKEEADILWENYQTKWKQLPGPDNQKPL